MPNEELEPAPEHEAILKIVSVNFDNGKWKFNDGESSFWASLEDKNFTQKMQSREINFAWGDMLKVKYFTQQKLRNGNLTKETIITKVIEIVKQPQQTTLDFEQEK